MDHEALRLIARLKIAAARAGHVIDVVRFAADRSYARATLQRYADQADEEGVLLVLQLMEKLGMVAPVRREAAVIPLPLAAAPAAVAASVADASARYVGRLR